MKDDRIEIRAEDAAYDLLHIKGALPNSVMTTKGVFNFVSSKIMKEESVIPSHTMVYEEVIRMHSELVRN